MKTADLSKEIATASQNVRQAHLDRIQALGVKSATIANLGATQPPFGVMAVDDIGGGIFQPGGLIPSIVQPVYDDGCLVDLIAWRSTDPARWLWRTGAAWALGLDSINENSWTDKPLSIEATPLDWLRSGATGLCILDWQANELRKLLRVPCLSAAPAIAHQLRGDLTKPLHFPRITAREGMRHAA